MSMTKQQKIGVCCGAVFGVCVLALGWFLYSAYDACVVAEEGDPEAGDEGLVAAKQKNKGFYAQSTVAKPFPSADTITSVKSNEAAYVKWRADAIEVAARGDCPPPPENLAATVFKQSLYDEVTRMQKLPGGVAGRICASGFLFGFDQYLGEQGGTPKRHELPQLYAQLGVITNVVDLFAKSGVVAVRKFERPVLEDPDAGQEAPRGKAKGKDKSGNASAAVDEPKRYDFKIEYAVRAPAFAKVLNELAKSPRFFVVSEFSFSREGEALREKLKRAGEASAAGGRSSSSRRHKREQKEQEVESGIAAWPNLPPQPRKNRRRANNGSLKAELLRGALRLAGGGRGPAVAGWRCRAVHDVTGEFPRGRPRRMRA